MQDISMRAIFARAREADLPALWQGAGKVITRRGSGWASPFSPCCGDGTRRDSTSITKQGAVYRYHCFRCGNGGTTIDFIATTAGVDLIAAAKKIVAGACPTISAPTISAPPANPARPSANSKAMREAILAMRGHGLDPAVEAYLSGRCISRSTMDIAMKNGLLLTIPANPPTAVAFLESSVGRPLMEAAGLWTKRWPAAAYRPLVFVNPTGNVAEFRTIVDDGSPKAVQFGSPDFPLTLKSGCVERVVIVEGGIDLLSAYDMGYGDNALLIGLFGASSWREAWADRITAKYPTARWQIGTDLDAAGDSCGALIAAQLDKRGLRSERIRPFAGKDWNDALMSVAA